LKKIFISHNIADKPIVRSVGAFLEQHGIKSWIDEGEIQAGDSLIVKVGHGIEDSDFLLAMISKNSIKSAWVQKEIAVSLTLEIKDRSIEVIPVKLDETPIPTMLVDKYYLDLHQKPFAEEMQKLLTKAKGEAPKPQKINLQQLYDQGDTSIRREVTLLVSAKSAKDSNFRLAPSYHQFLQLPQRERQNFIIHAVTGNYTNVFTKETQSYPLPKDSIKL